MKPIVSISEIPTVLSIEELMEVKGGDNNVDICSVTSSAFKCTKEGSGICLVANSGVVCQAPSSGFVITPPGPGGEGAI